MFTSYTAVIERHRKRFGETAVTLTGEDSPERAGRRRPRSRTTTTCGCVGNLIAAGVGITLTAGTHVMFNDLDWVPANHWQAEDRCYRIGQTTAVTVEYFLAAGTLDSYIADLLELKVRLIEAVEADEVPTDPCSPKSRMAAAAGAGADRGGPRCPRNRRCGAADRGPRRC